MSTALAPSDSAPGTGADGVGSGAAGSRPRQLARVVRSPLDRPLASYHLIAGITGLLLALGLVMVLSTTSATELTGGGSPYSAFAKQALGVLCGLAVMWGLSRTPPAAYRALAFPLLLVSICGLVLVLGFGTTSGGAERWIVVAGFQIQPSEFAKLAFLVWGADLLARKEQLGQLSDGRLLLVPLLPAAALVGMLVMLGDDLGTTFVLLVIVLALLWVAGIPGRLFAGMLALLGFVLLILIVVARYRFERIIGFFDGQSQYQLIQGKYALGSGGMFGVGLGDSLQKWGWVPNDNTDFIYSILGEELGMVGTACVALMYGGLAYAGLRVARRVQDPFMRLAAAGATAWIVTQALVNIAAVIGLLPITGVPLPLISQGLSSLLVTMAALGMLLAFARSEPDARQALLAAGPGIAARAVRRLGFGGMTGRRPRAARPGGRGRTGAARRGAAPSGPVRRTTARAGSAGRGRAAQVPAPRRPVPRGSGPRAYWQQPRTAGKPGSQPRTPAPRSGNAPDASRLTGPAEQRPGPGDRPARRVPAGRRAQPRSAPGRAGPASGGQGGRPGSGRRVEGDEDGEA